MNDLTERAREFAETHGHELIYEPSMDGSNWYRMMADFAQAQLSAAEGEKPETRDFTEHVHDNDLLCAGCRQPIFEGQLYVESKGDPFCHGCVLLKAKQNFAELNGLRERVRLAEAVVDAVYNNRPVDAYGLADAYFFEYPVHQEVESDA